MVKGKHVEACKMLLARARSRWRGTANGPTIVGDVALLAPSNEVPSSISYNSLHHNITPSFLIRNAKHKAELTGHRRSQLIQNLTQPLHTIQQYVSLPQHRLALRILHFRPICLDDPMYFVNGGMQTTGGDEAGEFATRPSSPCQYRSGTVSGCDYLSDEGKGMGTNVSMNSTETPKALLRLSSVKLL